MDQKKIKIVIDNKGNYSIEAMDGFTGQSCVEQTRTLEVAIGGSVEEEGKKNSYYDPDDGNPVEVTFE